MRIILLIFTFISLNAIAQAPANSLEELLEKVEKSRLIPLTPPECPGELLAYRANISYLHEGQSRIRQIILQIPGDFLEQESFCGYYDQGNYNWRISGEIVNDSLFMYLLEHEGHARKTLDFKTENSGVYIEERYRWQPYKKYEGTFTLEKLAP